MPPPGLLPAVLAPAHHPQLQPQKLLQNEVPPRFCQRLPALWKMDLPQGLAPRALGKRVRKPGGNRFGSETLQSVPHEASDHLRCESFGGGMDGRDPAVVHTRAGILVEHLELRVGQNQVRPGTFETPVNHTPKPLGQHSFHPLGVEPAQEKPRTQRVRPFFLKNCIQHFLAAAHPPHLDLPHNPAQAYRSGAFR